MLINSRFAHVQLFKVYVSSYTTVLGIDSKSTLV